jgi:hypothetical protein
MSMDAALEHDRVTRIRELNDAFRTTFAEGRVMMTASLAEEPESIRALILQTVADYTQFGPHNDPNGERDFGSFHIIGRTWNWRIDYYDKTLEFGSEDPADPAQTTRILTVGPAFDF